MCIFQEGSLPPDLRQTASGFRASPQVTHVLDSVKASPVAGRGEEACGSSLYLPLNFSANLKWPETVESLQKRISPLETLDKGHLDLSTEWLSHSLQKHQDHSKRGMNKNCHDLKRVDPGTEKGKYWKNCLI